MQIAIVGLGKVGRALTEQLTAEGHDIVAIDCDAGRTEDIMNVYDVRGVAGNGACYDVQQEAFETGADLLIATTSSDEINMLACLVAKKIGTRHTIARIRDPEYERQLRIMRGELGLSMIINPGGSFTLQEGDKIYLTATPRDLGDFFRRLGIFKARANNVMVVGASSMAYYLIKELRDIRMHITVIDSSAERCRLMSERLPGVLVIHGDAADSELLNEEGLADMDAFVALTGLDETNIILSMYAAQGDRCKVVAKVNRPSFAELATANGMLDSVVSTATVTSESILQYVRAMQNSLGSNIKALHRVVGGRVEALEFIVPGKAPYVNIPLKDLPIRQEVLLAGIVRQNGQAIIPSGSDTLQPGDDVVVITTGARINDLRDILQ